MSYKNILSHEYCEYSSSVIHTIIIRYYIGISMWDMMQTIKESVSSFNGANKEIRIDRDISFDYKNVSVVRKFTFILDKSGFDYMLFLIMVRSLDDYLETRLTENQLDNDDRKLL